jgi:ATP-dependent Clp protease adapter protein ClpS|tara:strand:+ start:1483 stop:1773 length:291 start_codon:yes stop_codon:yes gene_type:complete
MNDNDVEAKDKTLPPKKYAVIIGHSVATPDEFLIKVFNHVFSIPETLAPTLIEKCKVDSEVGLGIYNYEIAEQKIIEATKVARVNSMPIEFSLKAL